MAGTVIDALFGDLPVYAWPPGDDATEFPWTAFVEARRNPERAIELWRQIAADDDVASRHVAQAWHFLRGRGEQPPPQEAKRVLGIVVELGLTHAVDIIAVYADRSVHYYNHAGGKLVLRPTPPEHAELVDALLSASADVVARTPPWSGRHLRLLQKGNVRLSFLTPGGLHIDGLMPRT